MGLHRTRPVMRQCPRQDSNLRPRLRRPVLYPLSYGGNGASLTTVIRGPGGYSYAHGMPRVLLVDDDPAILRLLEVNFRLEGFDVVAAGHGNEALAAAEAATPDAVILDLMLPGMDGLEILRRLRALPETADVPVVLLTARGPDDALVAGAGETYVQKPFDTAELVTTVRNLLGEAPA